MTGLSPASRLPCRSHDAVRKAHRILPVFFSREEDPKSDRLLGLNKVIKSIPINTSCIYNQPRLLIDKRVVKRFTIFCQINRISGFFMA